LQRENFGEKLEPAYDENEGDEIKKFGANLRSFDRGTPSFPVEDGFSSALEPMANILQRKLRFFRLENDTSRRDKP